MVKIQKIIRILKMVGSQKAISTQKMDIIFYGFESTNHSDRYLNYYGNSGQIAQTCREHMEIFFPEKNSD